MTHGRGLRSTRVVLSYVGLAAVWIVGSDYAWARITGSTFDATAAQIGKGAVFVVVTAAFLYWRLRRDETQVRRQETELVRAYDATLEAWSRALDMRDHDTEGHSTRVAALTERIARQMGVPEGELVHVRRGALLHDIGKVGIPDRVLLKPAPLSEDERSVMQRHPGLAFEVLSSIEFLKPALAIPHGHHERWDGSGYPRGLRGAHIPLAARIFAVVDIWDALRSNRPYRRAWSDDEARSYIESLAGTHLDPQAVRVFLDVIDGKIGQA